VLKSWEDFASKMARGSPTENRKTWEYFDIVDSMANETCDFAVTLGQQCCSGSRQAAGATFRRAARQRSLLAGLLGWQRRGGEERGGGSVAGHEELGA
jgi:hypothetical protein